MRAFAILFLLLPSLALADPLLGIWSSPPDKKGQVGHLQIKPCGPAFCGTLIRAFDKSGAPTTTPNVGRRLMWDMRPEGGGRYGGGRVYVPIFKRDFAAEITLSGNSFTLEGCGAMGCRSQVWRKVSGS